MIDWVIPFDQRPFRQFIIPNKMAAKRSESKSARTSIFSTSVLDIFVLYQ